MLPLGVSVRLGFRAMVRVTFRVYILRLVHYYQVYCTVVMHYCYVTGGI